MIGVLILSFVLQLRVSQVPYSRVIFSVLAVYTSPPPTFVISISCCLYPDIVDVGDKELFDLANDVEDGEIDAIILEEEEEVPCVGDSEQGGEYIHSAGRDTVNRIPVLDPATALVTDGAITGQSGMLDLRTFPPNSTLSPSLTMSS